MMTPPIVALEESKRVSVSLVADGRTTPEGASGVPEPYQPNRFSHQDLADWPLMKACAKTKRRLQDCGIGDDFWQDARDNEIVFVR
jgi:hypothetical protein